VTAALPQWFEIDRYVPPPGTAEACNVARLQRKAGGVDYDALIDRAAREPEWFYPLAFDDLGLEWMQPFSGVVDGDDARSARWFVDGGANVARLCCERWRETRGPAVIWESDDGDTGSLGWIELEDAVATMARALRDLGVGHADVVALFLPMIPEAVIALLAVARVGAIAQPSFSGYGPDALAERLRLGGARVLITADAVHRRGSRVELLATARAARALAPTVAHVIVVGEGTGPDELRWVDLISGPSDGPVEALPAETPFLLAFTSGSTGAPKGVVHTHGGFVYRVAIDLAYHLDVTRAARLTWVTDMGWIMGPVSTLGALALGATAVLFGGVPDHPKPDRLWRLVDRHRITHLGLSPTVVRVLAGHGSGWVESQRLEPLRVLGSTGEPWTSAAWRWLHRDVGRGRVPIINWTGGAEIGNGILAGSPAIATRECRFAGPALGMSPAVFDPAGHPVVGVEGELVLTRSWPSMPRRLWRDDRRLATYWSRWPGVWVHGDRAIEHDDGSWELLGRSDDVIKVAGKRIGPAELEGVAGGVAGVVSAGAVGIPDPVKGEVPVVAVVTNRAAAPDVAEAVARAIAQRLGQPLRPQVVSVPELPLTRSGKLHRRALRAWLADDDAGDLSTLQNPDTESAVRAAGAGLRSAARDHGSHRTSSRL
jgi:acetyl-CoA synthetase